MIHDNTASPCLAQKRAAFILHLPQLPFQPADRLQATLISLSCSGCACAVC